MEINKVTLHFYTLFENLRANDDTLLESYEKKPGGALVKLLTRPVYGTVF